MDKFAQLPSDQRRPYFEQAAALLGLSAQMIEKDFWVCWSLRRLFSRAEFRGQLTFKGGTSLSKVYRAIARFSEDVDVAIERKLLGFGSDNDPEAIPHSLSEAQVHVRVLTAARTFWEKAAILHMLHHQPEGRKIAPRMSRHYYDRREAE